MVQKVKIGDIVKVGIRSFIIKDLKCIGYQVKIKRPTIYTNCGLYEFATGDMSRAQKVPDKYKTVWKQVPVLSRPIINGKMQKAGYALPCEKEIIMKGFAEIIKSNKE